MNKFIAAIACSLCLASAGTAVAHADAVEAADTAYMADDFATAARLYQQAIDSLGPSADRYYNLGNSYFRLEQPGRAIVAYERALRLDPTNADVTDNLEFVNSRITDRIEASDSFLADSMDSVASRLHPDTWAWVALVCFVLMLAGVVVYFTASSVTLRKVGFFGALVLLIPVAGANVLAYRAMKRVSASDRAVIVVPSTILSTTPRQPKDRSEEAFLLHEGTKVTILDSISDPADPSGRLKWYDVKVDNSHRAWIESTAVEII